MRLTLLAVPMVFFASSAQAACTVSAVSGVIFGNYNVFSATAATGTGSFAVRNCTSKKTIYTAELSTGSGTYAARTMTTGINTLQYNLYTSNSHTNVWGDGTGGSGTVSGTGTTTASGGPSNTIYGRVPAGQDVSAGSYTDSITITISF